jgi:antitoxin ParD1/3/4
MATMNISLSRQMKAWVEAQSKDGKYSNSSDYARDLIRREQVRKQKIAYVQKMVDDGIASGISTLTREELLQSARDQAAMSLNAV